MQLYPVFLFIDTRVLLKHRAIGYQMILIARFLSRHPALGTDARFRVSTRRMTFIIWQRLRPWRRASPKAMHSLGFSAALFGSPSISLRFLDFETSEFSCSWGFFGVQLPVPDPVPRSEEALCDDTPAQVNGGSVRDGICEPRLWNMGGSLTLALATSSLVLFQYEHRAWCSFNM